MPSELTTIRVREKTETAVVFASIDDMRTFLTSVANGQGVIFEYVLGRPKDIIHGEYIDPSIYSQVQDGKIHLTSEELKKEG